MKQKPPQGDNRYRTHKSVKCYVAEVYMGTVSGTWYLNDSAERVIYRFPDGSERVVYKNRFYRLQSAERLTEIAKRQFRNDGTFVIGGKHITCIDKDKSFEPHSFIDITSEEDRRRYQDSLTVP